MLVWVLCRQFVIGSERERYFLQSELSFLGSNFACRDNVRILVIKPPFVHLAVIYIKSGAHFTDSAGIPRLNIISR